MIKLKDHPLIKQMQNDIKNLKQQMKQYEIQDDLFIQRELSNTQYDFLTAFIDGCLPEDKQDPGPK